MKKPLIVALDYANEQEVKKFFTPFDGQVLFVKVGMELFYQTGPQLITELKEAGHHIFLDLKLHDIPNTVKGAMKGLAKLGVDIVNVHAAGGKDMMEAALEGLDIGTPPGTDRPLCVAVTQLTSTTQWMMEEELLINRNLGDVVLSYAQLTKHAGLDGVVCSALEVPKIKSICGSNFQTITPGIRLAGDAKQDQKRVVTPADASKLGSDAIVVGRSITQVKEPVKAYENIQLEWGMLNEKSNRIKTVRN
ncbi:orotidine-5'-phosphate decarboxylase [Salirhabdus salicampi]|uniref:orotidine-5'-phosphate decarboxylase n=1 Tax=Salirhabdus salicampi TaxID=476102 RepID=UPI0020C537DB|nr:orotidine-5'-phosphate decarboxylase [Salirhabdus salicampi]MCP8615966.1 orotidine-5'-phosphate decarboxylase [Salirhabdus salicampi]